LFDLSSYSLFIFIHYIYIDETSFTLLRHYTQWRYLHTGPVLRHFVQLLLIGPRVHVIYYRLFKYTQQHTAGCTENSIGQSNNKSMFIT